MNAWTVILEPSRTCYGPTTSSPIIPKQISHYLYTSQCVWVVPTNRHSFFAQSIQLIKDRMIFINKYNCWKIDLHVVCLNISFIVLRWSQVMILICFAIWFRIWHLVLFNNSLLTLKFVAWQSQICIISFLMQDTDWWDKFLNFILSDLHQLFEISNGLFHSLVVSAKHFSNFQNCFHFCSY